MRSRIFPLAHRAAVATTLRPGACISAPSSRCATSRCLFVCFVLISRGLGALATLLETKLRIQRKRVLASLLGLFAMGVSGGGRAAVEAHRALRGARAQTEWRDWFGALAANPALVRVRELTGITDDGISDAVKDPRARRGQVRQRDRPRAALPPFIGLIVAIMFVFEREELMLWRRGLAPGGIADTLLRWFGYMPMPSSSPRRMQLVSRLVNALVTLPILLLIGLKARSACSRS